MADVESCSSLPFKQHFSSACSDLLAAVLRVKRRRDLLPIRPNHAERERSAPPVSSLLRSVVEGQGNTFSHSSQQVSSWTGTRRATCCTASLATHIFPPKDPTKWVSLRNNYEERWFILHFQVILWTFWSKVRWLFFCCFFFSQGFPKWMAVKDFNILQAQQLILKSLAEGFYRGKLGCKSFWRLFPFWNL